MYLIVFDEIIYDFLTKNFYDIFFGIKIYANMNFQTEMLKIARNI